VADGTDLDVRIAPELDRGNAVHTVHAAVEIKAFEEVVQSHGSS
jgi:hypothetical protein